MAATEGDKIQECRQLLEKIPADILVEKRFRVAPCSKLAMVLFSQNIELQQLYFTLHFVGFLCNSSFLLTEVASWARELLQQFTEATINDQGNFVTSVIVHPFVMNGAARGYRLVERQDEG